MEDIGFITDIWREPMPPVAVDTPKPDTGLFSPVPTPSPDATYSPYPSFSDFSELFTVPAKWAAGAISSGYEAVSGTVKTTYLYLVGGVVLIGIVAIVGLGVAAKVMNKIEG